MKFNRYALSDLATIKYGKNQKKVLSENGNIPIYGTGGLMGYATTALYDKPSVLIGRKGTIGKVKYVEHPFWTVDTLFYTIVNTDIVLPKYLYYVMSLIDLNNYNEGTTIPSLRTETLNRLEFDIPSLVEQETILSCLNPIDEKIALNNAINNNLDIPYVPIVRLVTLIPKPEIISAKYLYLWLKQLHITGTGTTQQQLTVPDFQKTEILVPSQEIK